MVFPRFSEGKRIIFLSSINQLFLLTEKLCEVFEVGTEILNKLQDQVLCSVTRADVV